MFSFLEGVDHCCLTELFYGSLALRPVVLYLLYCHQRLQSLLKYRFLAFISGDFNSEKRKKYQKIRSKEVIKRWRNKCEIL